MFTFQRAIMSFGKLPAESLLLLSLLCIALIPSSCGGSSGTSTISPVPASSPLQVNVGDDPCDRVASLVVDFTAVNLKDDKGNSVPAMNGSSSVEFIHLLGTMQSISLVNVPKGTYPGAEISISSADISYLSPISGELTNQKVTGPWTVSFPISPAMTVTSDAVALNLHLAVGDSVSFDSSGNIVFNPKFTPDVFQGGSGNGHNHQYGGVDHGTGRISNISGSSFTLNMLQSSKPHVVHVDANTQFDGVDGISGLAVGMIVTVDADMQADGSLLAQEVDLAEHGSGGMTASGMMIAFTGSPATQITLIGQDASGTGVSSDDMGEMISANLDSNTVFKIDAGNVDLTGLPFTPGFSSTELYNGQAIEIVSGSGMMHDSKSENDTQSGSANVTEVHLENQGIRGVVSNHAANGNEKTFTLNLAAESYFSHVTGATSLMVFQRQDTEVWGPGTITDGANVVVHGLLFGGSDNYKLVASRIVVH